MLEVDEVRERLFAKGILTSEKSQTIKALLAKNGGINDAAKGLHQVCLLVIIFAFLAVGCPLSRLVSGHLKGRYLFCLYQIWYRCLLR